MESRKENPTNGSDSGIREIVRGLVLLSLLGLIVGLSYSVSWDSSEYLFAAALSGMATALAYGLLGLVIVRGLGLPVWVVVPFAGFVGGLVFGVVVDLNAFGTGVVGSVGVPLMVWLHRGVRAS